MKRETHIAITRKVCSNFCTQDQTEEIANASVLPDSEPDYIRGSRVRHHGREAIDMAFDYLKSARKAYLRGDRRYTKYLGKALHYIQDYSVNLEERWIFDLDSKKTGKVYLRTHKDMRNHNKIEKDIAYLPVPEEAVSIGLNEICTPGKVKKIIYEAQQKKIPEEIMFQATYHSTIAVKAVFKPDKPSDLGKKALVVHVIHVLLFILVFFAFALAYFKPYTLILVLILGIVGNKIDKKWIKNWELERDWFKL